MTKLTPIRNREEAIIQETFGKLLTLRGWCVKSTHGNMFQSGFPDDYICNAKLGARWVEYKVPGKYRFTAAQLEWFPLFNAHGVGVWVITAATEYEYLKLFKPQNWWQYL